VSEDFNPVELPAPCRYFRAQSPSPLLFCNEKRGQGAGAPKSDAAEFDAQLFRGMMRRWQWAEAVVAAAEPALVEFSAMGFAPAATAVARQ